MIEIRIADGIASFTAIDKVTLADCIQALDEYLTHPQRVPGMDLIWVGIDADLSAIRWQDMPHFAKEYAAKVAVPARRLAIVVNKPLQFGLARAWSAWSSNKLRQERRIFRTVEEATAWLKPEY